MKLEIYMKSGNVIKCNGVTEYKIENRGEEVVSVNITVRNILATRKLLVKTLNLSQIEGVVRVR